MKFEIGDRVKTTGLKTNYRGIVISYYCNEFPWDENVNYAVRLENTKYENPIFIFRESQLKLLERGERKCD